MKRGGRTARARPAASRRRSQHDYNFDYAGTTGENDQNEYGGDLYGGGRDGRGPFEQSQRYGAGGFDSRTGAFGSLQRQYENRYTSGGYTGLKTSGRALVEPPDAGSTPAPRVKQPRAGTGDRRAGRTGTAARARSSTRARSASGESTRPRAASGARGRTDSPRVRAKTAGKRASAAPATRRSRATAAARSDNRIRQEICARLSKPFERFDASDLVSERLDVSDVTVSVADGKVTLEGTVPERRMKHYIEDLVDACPGVQDIDNRIRLRR